MYVLFYGASFINYTNTIHEMNKAQLHNIISIWAHICHIYLKRWMLFVISRCHFCFFCQWQHFLRFHNMINDCKRTTTVRLLSSFYTSFLLHFTLLKEKWTHKLEYAHQVFSFFMIAAEHVLTFIFFTGHDDTKWIR